MVTKLIAHFYHSALGQAMLNNLKYNKSRLLATNIKYRDNPLPVNSGPKSCRDEDILKLKRGGE
jgi:hypothetical protein